VTRRGLVDSPPIHLQSYTGSVSIKSFDFWKPSVRATPRTKAQQAELEKCKANVTHFIDAYCQIYNATEREWVRFDLWDAQRETLHAFRSSLLSLVLKARQLGLSWLTLCHALYDMLFHPAATVLIFSKRDEEAIELLGRLKGIHERLPVWMRGEVVASSAHDFGLSNGSSAKAFPTTGGRSYTGSLVIVDEADFVQDLDALLNAVKPTIDAGGQMIMISTVDKSRPESPFKRIYRAAKRGKTEWQAIFLPWHARPGRTAAWYEAQKADVLARTGALDDLHQEYPATDTEALAPRSLDKRISPMWIEACYAEREPLTLVDCHASLRGVYNDAPSLPNLEIYTPPQPGRKYVLGADPAEGNPTSDDSALTVVDVATGEECAVLAGKVEPATFGSYIAAVSAYYHDAPAMIERNNHGHAVLQWVEEHAGEVHLLAGHDDKRGWLSSGLGKALLYTECADHFRVNAQDNSKVLHSFATYQQLASIEGATLRAPEGQHDDRADSYALAQVARSAEAGTAAVAQAVVRGRGHNPMVRRSVRRVT